MWPQCRLKIFSVVVCSVLFDLVAGWEVSKGNHGRLVSFEDVGGPVRKDLKEPPLWNLRAQRKRLDVASAATAAASGSSAADPTTTAAAPTTTTGTTTKFDGVNIKVVIQGAPVDSTGLENDPSTAAKSIKTAWSAPSGKLKDHLTASGWDGSQLPPAVIGSASNAVATSAPEVTTTTPPPPTTSQSTTTVTTTTAKISEDTTKPAEDQVQVTTPPPITTKEAPTTTASATEAPGQPAPAKAPEFPTAEPPEKVAEMKEVNGEVVPCVDGQCATTEGGPAVFEPTPT